MSATFEQLTTLPAEQAFDAMGKVQEDELPLLAASLMVARDEYPELDTTEFERLAQSYATRAETLGASSEAPMAAMRVINTLLFEELGFTGNTGDYYDPRNSYVNDVFERKLGIPISLAVIQLDLARRLGLPLEGVSFPGHFLVRLPVDGGLLVLDPFHKGRSLDADEL
jgi:regulator of sirC expression with transglutaminase-like and TPR domain